MADLNKLLVDFAKSFEAAIGTDETTVLLEGLTNFAQNCPETLMELKVVVEENPEMFAKLLTPEGVVDAKQMITMVSEYAPMFEMFKG